MAENHTGEFEIGARVAGGLLNYEQQLQALRAALTARATTLAKRGVSAAAAASRSGIESARAAMTSAINTARMQGNRNVATANRALKESVAALKPALREGYRELGYAKRGMKTAVGAMRSQLQSVVRANPFRNYMAGGRAFTAEEAARAAAGGPWRRVWQQAAGYRAANLRQGFSPILNHFNPVIGNIQNAASEAYSHIGAARTALQNAVTTGKAAVEQARNARTGAIGVAKITGIEGVRRAANVGAAGVKNAITAGNAAVANAGKLSGVKGAVVAVGDAVRAVGGKVGQVVKPVTGYLSRSLNTTPSWAGAKEAALASKILRFNPVRLISAPAAGVLGKIEAAAAGTFSKATMLGKGVRALTSAKGNAMAFAIGSWLEAGYEAYKYFTEDRKINGEATLIGEGSVFADKNFWKAYGADVGKKLTSAATLGIFGNDGGWWDRVVGGEAGSDDEYLARQKEFSDNIASGLNPDGTAREGGAKDVAIMEEARKRKELHDMRMSMATMQLDPNENLKGYLTDLLAEKEARVNSHELYRGREMNDVQRARVAAKYDGYIAAALENPLAKETADKNRNQFYTLVTKGRNYEKDYAAAGKDPAAVKGFDEFNKRWEARGLQAQVMYDHKKEVADYNEAYRKAMGGE